jgi:hypothetical protein
MTIGRRVTMEYIVNNLLELNIEYSIKHLYNKYTDLIACLIWSTNSISKHSIFLPKKVFIVFKLWPLQRFYKFRIVRFELFGFCKSP